MQTQKEETRHDVGLAAAPGPNKDETAAQADGPLASTRLESGLNEAKTRGPRTSSPEKPPSPARAPPALAAVPDMAPPRGFPTRRGLLRSPSPRLPDEVQQREASQAANPAGGRAALTDGITADVASPNALERVLQEVNQLNAQANQKAMRMSVDAGAGQDVMNGKRDRSDPGVDTTEEEVSPAKKTRRKSSSNPRKIDHPGNSSQGNGSSDFKKRVEDEYQRMKKELIQEYGHRGGGGRLKGWRMSVHSHEAIAKRLAEEDRDRTENPPRRERLKPGPKPRVVVDRNNPWAKTPAWLTGGRAGSELGQKSYRVPSPGGGRTRKSGAISGPHRRTVLADTGGSNDSDDSDAIEDLPLSRAYTGRGTVREGGIGRRLKSDDFTSPRTTKFRTDRGKVVDKNRSKSAKAAWVKRRANAAAAVAKETSSPGQEDMKVDGAKRKEIAPIEESDQLSSESDELDAPAASRRPLGAGLGRAFAGLKPRSEETSVPVLGLGGGLPQKRQALVSSNPYLRSSLQPVPSVLRGLGVQRHGLHVDDRDMQNHCTIFNNTLYISGIRIPDALLPHCPSYQAQISSVLDTVDRHLKQHETSKHNILMATVVLQDPVVGVQALNKAWKEWIPDPKILPGDNPYEDATEARGVWAAITDVFAFGH